MPITYSAGLIEHFKEIVEEYDVVSDIESIMQQLRDQGASETQIDEHLHRKYGFPMDSRKHYDRLPRKVSA